MLLSVLPVLAPECEPAQSNHENHEAYKIAETEGFAVSVAKIIQNLILSRSSLRHLCHENFSTVLHRRYPARKCDEWVGFRTGVSEASRAKSEKHHH